jgi:hypothetical protein
MSIDNAAPEDWDNLNKKKSGNQIGKKPVFSTTIKKPDYVNSPSHYASQGVECIDYIRQQLTDEEFKGYLLGNVHKYLHRHKYKNQMLDLEKMQWYFKRYVEEYEEN